MFFKVRYLLLVLFTAIVNITTAQNTYPKIIDFCTDYAGIFTEEEKLSLDKKLLLFENETSHQLVVLTVESLGDDVIENFANKTFNQNKIGQKGVDNGLLILFANQDKKVRIEVGKGLEHIITDFYAKRIIVSLMIPQFKQKNYYKGIDRGLEAIISLIENPEYQEEFDNKKLENYKIPFGAKVFLAIIIIIFSGLFMFMGGMAFKDRYGFLITFLHGLIVGKVSLLRFPFLWLGLVFPACLSSTLFIAPIVIIGFLIAKFILGIDIDVSSIMKYLEASKRNIIIIGAVIFVIVFVIIPLLIVFRRRKNNVVLEPLKVSFFKTTEDYRSKIISSRGSLGYNSSSGSSSGGSFSGGGGSSGGGGASGSW